MSLDEYPLLKPSFQFKSTMRNQRKKKYLKVQGFPKQRRKQISKSYKKSFAKQNAQGKHVVRDNMPCLCQYFTNELKLRVEESLSVTDNDANSKGSLLREVSTGEVSASELAASKAETLSLKEKLSRAQISAENMEVLVKIMIDKQNFLMTEVLDLKQTNESLRLQQVTDRNNQALERTILLKEMHEIKLLLQDRSHVVEKTLQQNYALTEALKDANEKIYSMGMKFLKLKRNRPSSRQSSRNSVCSDEGSSTDLSADSSTD